MKAAAREPWAIGQAIESCASVAFFLRAMASIAERSRRFLSILALSKRGSRARMSSTAISSILGTSALSIIPRSVQIVRDIHSCLVPGIKPSHPRRLASLSNETARLGEQDRIFRSSSGSHAVLDK